MITILETTLRVCVLQLVVKLSSDERLLSAAGGEDKLGQYIRQLKL